MRERVRMERELEALAFDRDVAAAKKNVVLVAGFDSNFSGIDFEQICRHRIRRYWKRPGVLDDADYVYTVFDVGRGQVKTLQRSVVAGKPRWEWTVDRTRTFTPVTRANYVDKQFRKKPEGVMSITDVYAYIRGLGRGSVREFSFFGHGWIEGPVLVNSFEREDFKGKDDRDPEDKDARGRKDFTPPNMTAAERKEFAEAFHEEGFTWVWGCSFEEHFRQVLHQVVTRHPFVLTAPGKVQDADDLSFSFSKKQAEQFFGEDAQFFPAAAGGKQPLAFKKTFKEVKEFFQRGLERSYCHHAARATGRKCYGALPGTYTDLEKGVSLPLMLVPRDFARYKANLTRYVSFYKTHFGIKEDPESRGYGTFQ